MTVLMKWNAFALLMPLLLLSQTKVLGNQLFLEKLFTATNGTGWSQSTLWLQPNVSSCLWVGITCNSEGNILEISLPRNKLKGLVEGLDFSEVPTLTVLDLSDNELSGRVPATIFYLPYIRSVALQRNRFTKLQFREVQELTPVSASLQSVLLSGNRFFCPLSEYVIREVIPRVLDVTPMHCVRTMTLSRAISPTIQLEAPVLALPNATDVEVVLIASEAYDKTLATSFLVKVASILTGILNRTIPQAVTLPQDDHATSLASTFLTVSGPIMWSGDIFVNVSFSSNVSQTARRDLVARLQTGHSSVAALLTTRVVIVKPGGTLADFAETGAPPLATGAIATDTFTVFLAIGGSALFLLIVAVIGHRFMSRHPYSDFIQPNVHGLP